MADTIQTTNPATGEALETYRLMSESDAADAVEACHAAHLDWSHRSLEDRAKVIAAIGDMLKKHKKDFADLMSREMGKVRSQGDGEIELCAAICQYTAENGPDELAPEDRDLMMGGRGRIAYSPIGVVYGIQPWNFPAYQAVRYSIASLMAGNGVLLKHAANVTGSALMLEQIYREAGLPEDLFKVLVVDHDGSDKVLDHDLVRGVTLTGSPDAGRIIAEKAGERLKKTVLELGSNDAYLILQDADIDRAVKQCVQGRIFNNGETCVAAKRFIPVASVYDEFREKFIAAMKDVKVGDPFDAETDLGPMAREDLRDELHEQVLESIKAGAVAAVGGEKPERPGYFYPATVLERVDPGQPAYKDELFGPVASLIRAEDEDDAFRIANDSKYGLGGAIFSNDEERAFELAATRFDTGMVFVKGFGLAQPDMPFGGVKDSGYGREHGGFGMKEFVNAKSIMRLRG